MKRVKRVKRAFWVRIIVKIVNVCTHTVGVPRVKWFCEKASPHTCGRREAWPWARGSRGRVQRTCSEVFSIHIRFTCAPLSLSMCLSSTVLYMLVQQGFNTRFRNAHTPEYMLEYTVNGRK